jgi:hypothetical protein
MLGRGTIKRSTAMSNKSNATIATMGIDIGKNSFHVVGLDQRGAIVLRQKWSRGQIEARLSNLPPCLVGMEACVGAHHLSRKLTALGHDSRLMPAKYVRPYSKGQKNDPRCGGDRRGGAAQAGCPHREPGYIPAKLGFGRDPQEAEPQCSLLRKICDHVLWTLHFHLDAQLAGILKGQP